VSGNLFAREIEGSPRVAFRGGGVGPGLGRLWQPIVPGKNLREKHACEALLEGQAQALTQKAVEMALAGDTVALRICIERICPIRRDRPVSFELPAVTCARDAADISAAVMAAVSNGNITLSEAAEISKLIDSYVKAYQTAELNDRVVCVERMSTDELVRIIRNGSDADAAPPLITIGSR
jgi:hypothetical protein